MELWEFFSQFSVFPSFKKKIFERDFNKSIKFSCFELLLNCFVNFIMAESQTILKSFFVKSKVDYIVVNKTL